VAEMLPEAEAKLTRGPSSLCVRDEVEYRGVSHAAARDERMGRCFPPA
jgi:hypothetical protein